MDATHQTLRQRSPMQPPPRPLPTSNAPALLSRKVSLTYSIWRLISRSVFIRSPRTVSMKTNPFVQSKESFTWELSCH